MNDKQLAITPQREGENNRQYANRVLMENIMTLRLAPGAVLNEAEWSQILGISRTPIREAILRLKDYHLVDVYPQKASVVSRIDMELVNEGYFLRSEIEPVVFTQACGNLTAETVAALRENLERQKEIVHTNDVLAFFALDNEFHKAIYAGARKKHIWQAIQSVSSHFERVRHFDALREEMYIDRFLGEHMELFYSLVSGSEGAIRAMYPGHLAFYKNSLPALMQQYPDYFTM